MKEKWGIGVLFLSVAALCYILGQLGFISWVPEYAKSLGMSLGDAGKLVSDFWMSYMIGMWSFSFILRFFDLQRILTVLAGLATVLMYLFINGSPEHMPWFILTLGFFSSAIYTSIITLGSQQTRVASPKLVNFILTCRHHRHHAHFRGHRPRLWRPAVPWPRCTPLTASMPWCS